MTRASSPRPGPIGSSTASNDMYLLQMMDATDFTNVTGFITRERWIIGRTPREMESLLGFRRGRMAQGAGVYALVRLPQESDFDFVGYTHLSGGMSTSEAEIAKKLGSTRSPQHEMLRAQIEMGKAKKVALNNWTTVGRERLVKVIPNFALEVESYPPGYGVEQWKFLKAVPARLVKALGPIDVYRPSCDEDGMA